MAMLQKSRVLKIYKARLQFFPLGGLCKSFLRFELECRYTNVFQLATRSPLSDHSNIMSCCQSLQASFCHQIIPKQCKTISIIIATTWYFPNIILLLTFKFVDVSPYNSPPPQNNNPQGLMIPAGGRNKTHRPTTKLRIFHMPKGRSGLPLGNFREHQGLGMNNLEWMRSMGN